MICKNKSNSACLSFSELNVLEQPRHVQIMILFLQSDSRKLRVIFSLWFSDWTLKETKQFHIIKPFTVFVSSKHTQAMLAKYANTHSECVLTRGPLHCTCRWTSFSADISSSSSSLILCSLSGSSRQDGCNKQMSGRRGWEDRRKGRS